MRPPDDRQRHWLFGDDGSRPHSDGDRRQAETHNPGRSVERRRAGSSRVTGCSASTLGTSRNRSRHSRNSPAYFNIDSGTGRARGLTIFGRLRPRRPREATASFADLGLLGVTTTRSRQATSTDAFSFAAAGLPASTRCRTRSIPVLHLAHQPRHLRAGRRDDVKKSAIVMAAAVYHLATRDDPLPRFTHRTDAKTSCGADAAPGAAFSGAEQLSTGSAREPLFAIRA